MKESLLEYIVCPVCNGTLSLSKSVFKNDEVMAGVLACANNHSFMVSDGIPRLLLQGGLVEAQKETQNTFSQKWSKIPDYGYEPKTRKFHLKWYLQRYGWGSLDNLSEFLGTRKLILDAGTGLGRDSGLYAEHTAGQVFGVDISQSIDIAYRHIGHLPNVHLIQADLTNLPFREGFFDFVASDAVLHHTPSTEESFKYLCSFLSSSGQIAICVYKRKGAIREFCDDYIRGFTTKLSVEECYKFSEAMTKFGKSLSDMKTEIVVPEDIQFLGIKAGKHDLQRFIYWNVFKCFWNDDYNFETNVMVNFDWYHPRYAHRHTPEEVGQWFDDIGLKVLYFDVGESGVSARGRK